VRVIDPAPAIGRQVGRLLEASRMKRPAGGRGDLRFITTGDPASMAGLLPLFLGETGPVERVNWQDDQILI
jgi:glutamate racemase